MKQATVCRWGDWVLDPETLEIYLDNSRWSYYRVDLETMRTSAEMLDWIFQIHTLGLFEEKPERMFDFICALDDLLKPQANLCSAGMNKTIPEIGELLRKRIARLE